jgi:hypothetical protein
MVWEWNYPYNSPVRSSTGVHMASSRKSAQPSPTLQRPPAEILYADQLVRLSERNSDVPRPPGWQLSLTAARAFILGNAKLDIAPKIVAPAALLRAESDRTAGRALAGLFWGAAPAAVKRGTMPFKTHLAREHK